MENHQILFRELLSRSHIYFIKVLYISYILDTGTICRPDIDILYATWYRQDTYILLHIFYIPIECICTLYSCCNVELHGLFVTSMPR